MVNLNVLEIQNNLKIDYSTGYIFQLNFKNNKYDKNIKEDCDKLLKELKNKINGCDKLNDKMF